MQNKNRTYLSQLSRLFLLLFLFQSTQTFSQQDFGWWNETHQWDGNTHWTRYMILSPAHLGPNALPVPEIYPATIPGKHSLELGTEGHYSTGDQTINLYSAYTFPLFSKRASFQISYRPVEVYKTDTYTRDLRISRQEEPSGYSLGDVYLSTYIQAIKEHAYMPDLMLSVNLRTASGTNLEGARHSDTPGYWLDATMGKGWEFEKKTIQQLRLFVKAGFYAYQTFQINHYQNDALLYGFGVLSRHGNISLQNQIGGYTGYFGNGDSPLVYRLIIDVFNQRSTTLHLIFQQGLRDYNFSSLRISALIQLGESVSE